MKFPVVLASFTLALASAVAAAPTPVSGYDIAKRATATNALIGYATLNGGTTGGAGGSKVTVKTLSELRNAVKGTAKKIVTIEGIIKGDGKLIDVGSNTSLLGKSGGSVNGLTGGGFRVKGGKNVIIRNLKLSLSKAPTDLVAIDSSTNVWVDHCDFSNDLNSGKDFYDGALDISHAADFITVSWNTFHDTFKTSLIGHSDNNGSEDKGKLRVTYHHNLFSNVGSRLPSLRFGTAHLFNNYYLNVKTSGINSRLGAQALIENNVFEKVKKPIMTSEEGGFAVQRGNTFIGSDAPDTSKTGTLTKAPYTYSLDPVGSTASIVKANAKVGSSIAF